MTEEIKTKLIEEEMKESYLDYSMSVIVSRALPDVRDGLKPVHRRILYAMHDMGLKSNKPFVKSARVVGECFKYHPHGDASIYDSLVRMAQDFSLRYPLVFGHGNFGSIDGFKQAHMRYTECKLQKISEELLEDIDKDTVNFMDNFDGSLKEPVVLPAKIPNLLINGSSGIAVGMTTNIPPHNIKEVCEATIKLIENPEMSIEETMNYVKGPDFPTAGIICGASGIKHAYKTGKGKITLRAKSEIEQNKIIITEIPYQVNKSMLLSSIAQLVKEKRIEGISNIRDESDKNGLRIVIETKGNPELIQNQLYKNTNLEITFGIIMLSLVDNQPRVLNLKQILEYYLNHRIEVVTRRTKFELNKAEDRAHILEGLKIALENIDPVIKLIKSSKNAEEAKTGLINNYNLSEKQAMAILDMKLQRLTNLETEKINEEHKNLVELIKKLKEILSSREKILEIIKEELNDIKNKYGDERKTLILQNFNSLEKEDLIKEEEVVLTLTNSGYIKRTSLELYKQQKRGGKGIIVTTTKEEDFLKEVKVINTKSSLLIFTTKGKVHWLKSYQVPEGSRYAKGTPIINLLNLEKGESVNSLIAIDNFSDGYLVMATKNGIIKKTALSEYSNPRKGGIIAINLKENDILVNVKVTNGNEIIILGTKNGKASRFNEEDIRIVGRNSQGVRGIKLVNDAVIGMETSKNPYLLTITENGFGKKTEVNEYRLISRGGKGVTNIKITDKNGKVVSIKNVSDKDEMLVITKKGNIIRVKVSDISSIGRNTQGVRIMRLDENDKIVSATKIVSEEKKDFTLDSNF